MAFGDVIRPAPRTIDYPTLLDLPAPRLRAYPPEPVVAEKFQAIVALGIANTRMKDFYDLWVLAERMDFAGPDVRDAIASTFPRRRTPVPAEPPVALTSAFDNDASKRAQWAAFLARTGLEAPALPDVVDRLRVFLLPPARSISRNEDFDQMWPPGGPWRPRGASSSPPPR